MKGRTSLPDIGSLDIGRKTSSRKSSISSISDHSDHRKRYKFDKLQIVCSVHLEVNNSIPPIVDGVNSVDYRDKFSDSGRARRKMSHAVMSLSSRRTSTTGSQSATTRRASMPTPYVCFCSLFTAPHFTHQTTVFFDIVH